MAQENRNELGFADPNFALINGDHWQSNAKRRYIQCHAWVAELADIILEYGLFHNRNAQYRENRNSPPTPLAENGPLEIIKYAEKTPALISLMNPNIQLMVPNALTEIRRIRNAITHKRIDSSRSLKELLDEIEALCP